LPRGQFDSVTVDRGWSRSQGKYSNGGTTLFWAVWYNRSSIAALLLNGGAGPKPANEEGMTPLECAVKFGKKLNAQLLMKAVTERESASGKSAK
jgi:hypothetical protein